MRQCLPSVVVLHGIGSQLRIDSLHVLEGCDSLFCRMLPIIIIIIMVVVRFLEIFQRRVEGPEDFFLRLEEPDEALSDLVPDGGPLRRLAIIRALVACGRDGDDVEARRDEFDSLEACAGEP